MKNTVQEFWAKFLESRKDNSVPESYRSWSFGNTPEMADQLAALVLTGSKRATTSLASIYEKFPEEEIPLVGDFNIILNALGTPVCVTETTRVERRKFSEIDDEYARAEGEGDLSLKYWRDVHWKFFSKECELVGQIPTEDMIVICEYFKVVFTLEGQ